MQIMQCIFQSSSQIRPSILRLYLATQNTATQKTVVIFILSGIGTTKLAQFPLHFSEETV
jgi:hypothetical protein